MIIRHAEPTAARTPDLVGPRVSRFASLCWPWLLSATACVLSLLRTGYSFDLNNNTFHIPIVMRFADLPQFANDPFVLSLRGFVSPVYPLLSLLATDGNVAGLFLAALIVTHLLTFFAFLRIGEACGVESRREQISFVFLLVASQAVYGYSPVGGDGLLIYYFSHTELAQAVALLAIASLLRGRPVRTGALAGVAFALNAFVGVWLLAPLAADLARRLAAPPDRTPRTTSLKTALLTGVAFAIPAAPIAAWIASTTGGAIVDFDYRAFLEKYAFIHFFLHATEWWSLCVLAFIALAGVLATGLISSGREARLVLASLGCVFGVGVLVGMFAESRLILNLHLLRVDGLFVLLCTALVAAAVVLQVRRGQSVTLAAAAIACLGLFGGPWLWGWPWFVAAAAMLVANISTALPVVNRLPLLDAWRGQCQRAFMPGILVCAAVASLSAWGVRQIRPVGTPPSKNDLMGIYAPVRDWLDVQRWARESTPANAVFLIPADLEGFRTGARRRIWVNWKDGATAMWAPETFHDWHQRLEEVRRLDGLAPTLAYACAHGIDYVVLDLRTRQGKPMDAARALFVNAWFEVHRPQCAVPG